MWESPFDWKTVNWVKGRSHNHGQTFGDNKSLSSGAGNRG